jgi:hypothetical protein
MATLEKPTRTITQTHNAFIPAWLDDAGLTTAQFRLFCHVARRGICFETLDNIARVCRVKRRTAQLALKHLEDTGFVSAKREYGRPVVYASQSHARVVPQTAYPPNTRIGLQKGSTAKGSRGTGCVENARVPTKAQIKAFADSQGLDELHVDAFMEQREKHGWQIDGEPIRYWQKALQAFCDHIEDCRTGDWPND